MRWKRQGIAEIKEADYAFNLRNAIIASAAKELRGIYKGMGKASAKIDEAIAEKDYEKFRKWYIMWWRYDPSSLEKWFRSDYYQSLTDIDGEYIIEKLKEEVWNY